MIEFLSENWTWIVFGAVFVWLHLGMHGGRGHGSAGGGCGAHAHGSQPHDEHAGDDRMARG